MALQDLLNAISTEADQRIAQARSAHQKHLTQLREGSERLLAKKRQEVAVQKEQKKNQMKQKAQAHAESLRRNALLQKKQDILNRIYNDCEKALVALPDNKVEPLIRDCLKRISGKGTIHPAGKHAALLKKLAPSEQFTIGDSSDASGGFVFTSDKIEQDFTFAHLVQEELRPKTELDVSHKLF